MDIQTCFCLYVVSTLETQTYFHVFSCFTKKHIRVSVPQLLTNLEQLETAGTIRFFDLQRSVSVLQCPFSGAAMVKGKKSCV